MRVISLPLLRRAAIIATVVLLAGCAIAKPRHDDPLESFNRKVYAFNDAVDKAVIRPVAVGYRKVTNPPVRRAFSDFFTNLRLPITIANDLLQARPGRALKTSGRFLVNLTVGLGGFFDPASHMGIPLETTDFGITLARWGVPDGPYLVLPFIGPTTGRDVWGLPVDSYFFDPLSIYARTHSYKYGQQYFPTLLHLVGLRASAIDAESFLNSAFDPYIFLRDAYRQRRVYKLYDGNPPASAMGDTPGADNGDFDPDQLLEEQRAWEDKNHQTPDQPQPAPAGSSSQQPPSPEPAPASSSGGP